MLSYNPFHFLPVFGDSAVICNEYPKLEVIAEYTLTVYVCML